MPTTINGVGTHYYGHSNSEKRTSICRSCGRTGALESYDTRLWFVVVFIPIIPLGRKRILDQCSSCRRHYVVDGTEWETQKQLNVSGALERYQREGTPEAAMEAHQQFLNFRQTAEAAEFRRQIAETFRQNARVQAYLGQALSSIGQQNDAQLYFQRAIELRPDLPEARVGIALDHVRRGEFKEARALLDFLEKPGAAQLYSLEPLEILADALQRANRHAEALELYAVLLAALPQIGDVAAFRGKVQRSEKIIARRPSLLPKRKFSSMFKRTGRTSRPGGFAGFTWKGLAIAGGVGALVAFGLLLANEYTRRHRNLYVVNAFPQAATVEIRGVGTVHVGGHPLPFTLAEGHYHASVSGPIREEFDFDVRSDSFVRLGDDAVWMLNVGGAALVLETRAVYREFHPPPQEIKVHFGRPIERMFNITHLFTSLPDTVQMARNEEKVLTSLSIYAKTPMGLLHYVREHGSGAEARRLIEWRLQNHPEDDDALEALLAMDRGKQTEDFLHAGLARRPVVVNWHRAYEDLHRTGTWLKWLAVEYDGMLASEPQNALLLYLRGRISPGREAEEWMKKVQAADPRNPYPMFVLGYLKTGAADWNSAKILYGRGAALDPSREEFADNYLICRLALGEYAGLESDLRAELQKDPRSYKAVVWLVEVLATQGRKTETRDVIKTFTTALQKDHALSPATTASMIEALGRQWLYCTGDLTSLEKQVAGDHSTSGREWLFIALSEQGKCAEAERIHSLDDPKLEDPYRCFVMSLAWLKTREGEKANAWLKRGLELLAAGSEEELQAANLLGRDPNPSVEKWQAIPMAAKYKALLVVANGVMHADQKRELFAFARELNHTPGEPSQLLHRVMGDSP